MDFFKINVFIKANVIIVEMPFPPFFRIMILKTVANALKIGL